MPVGNKSFKSADSHRLALYTSYTLTLTLTFLRAYSSTDSRKRALLCYYLICRFKVSLCNLGNEFGYVYCIDNLSKNDCRILCKTNLNEYLQVPEGVVLRINSKSLSDCLKSGKTKILGFYVNNDNELIFKTETCDFNVGNYEFDKKLNIAYLNEICNNVDYTCDLTEVVIPISVNTIGYCAFYYSLTTNKFF